MATIRDSSIDKKTIGLEICNPDTLYDPTPNGYSHVVIARNISRVIFIAGQGGEDKHGALTDDFERQVVQACSNLRAALDAAGAAPENIVKLNTYVVNHDETKLSILADALSEALGGHLPAQTLVPVSRLAINGMLFEVDATIVSD